MKTAGRPCGARLLSSFRQSAALIYIALTSSLPAKETYKCMAPSSRSVISTSAKYPSYPMSAREKSEGLTAQGRRIVREMQRQHMAVDTAHLNEAGFWDLFRLGAAAPMASHSCCRALCDHPRNLTDEQIREMIRGGGYIGMNFYPSFLSETGKADLSTVVRHIRHICDLGGEHILGFGSDFDGIETTPEGLTGAQDFPALLDALSQAGFSESTIRGFAGENLRSYYSRI